MRNYRLRLQEISKNQVDMITAALKQWNEYKAIVRGDPVEYYMLAPGAVDCDVIDKEKAWAQSRIDLIDSAASACGLHDDLIAVCCCSQPAPPTAAFRSARRRFYSVLNRIL